MPLKRMGYVYQQFQAAQGASAQAFAFLDLEEERAEQPGAKLLSPFSREIVFDDVWFSYGREASLILENIRLMARRGEVIALVGSSGAGKTTLVNLIPRFYELTSGEIRFDGVDIKGVTIKSLREQIAVVTQENILFADTVWNNICYGLKDVPEERVIAAAQAARAHDVISALPQRYHTLLLERGQRLSGGARAKKRAPPAGFYWSPALILHSS